MSTYENFVQRYPEPLPEAIEARQKLADLPATTRRVGPAQLAEGIVAADASAGGARTDRSATSRLGDRSSSRARAVMRSSRSG